MPKFTPSMLLTDKFKLAVEFVLKHEGGYSNDPDDLGKETKWGISKKSYPELDIKNLSRKEAIEIYRRDYWDRCHCEGYDYALALSVFDTAVNCGTARAMKWVRDCGGKSEAVLFQRVLHYAEIDNDPKKKKYTVGWLDRVAACYNEGRKYST